MEARKNDVAPDTLKRNGYSMKLFMEVVGEDMPISNLKSSLIDQFKRVRFEQAIEKYIQLDRKLDEDKIKRGINKELENVRTVLRAGVDKEFISIDQIPKIERYRVDRQRLPKYLDDSEIIEIANNLTGETKLAFWIIRYTAARRSEVARKTLNDDRGLKWSDIDWMRNKVRLYAKKKERLVPLHPTLRKLLLERKAELGESWHPDDHIIHYVRDTLTEYFKRAMEKAGIN